MKASLPALSVLLVTSRPFGELGELIRRLRKQGPVDRIELVVVAPSLDRLGLDKREFRDFGVVQVLEYGPFDSVTRPFASAVRAAKAPVVAFAEGHAFPERGWAEALIQAQRDSYGAVGAAITNANPGSALSWGNLLVAYGPWVAPVRPGVVDDLPTANVSFRRDALLSLGNELEELLKKRSGLLPALRARGYELYLEPAARVGHLNFSRLSPTARYRVNESRMLAAARTRTEDWSLAKRLLYLLGGPLIPGVRLARILGDLRGRGHPLHPRVVLGLAVALLFDGVGQMLAFGLGRGRSLERLDEMDSQWERRTDRPRDA